MNFLARYYLMTSRLPIIVFFFALIALPSHADRTTLYSINTGSFLFHLLPFDTDSNQYFDNNYLSIERKFSEESEYSLFVGTFLNSQANRCFLLGARKDWYQVNNKLTIKGVYSYAGEFFFDAFEHCGDGGFYKTSKEKTGVGFAPYIYHSAQYNFTDHFALEAGFILPLIFVMSVQWSF